MTLPETLGRHLQEQGVPVELVEHASVSRIQQAAALVGADPATVARAVLVKAGESVCLVVLPTDRLLDFDALAELLRQPVATASAEDLQRVFPDCHPPVPPALGQAYGLVPLVDACLDRLESLWLGVGRCDALLKISGGQFQQLFARSPRGDFSRPMRCEDEAPPGLDKILSQLYELPTLPHTGCAVLELYNAPDSDVERLSAIVEQDPSLAAQVVRYARSPFFGYRGTIDNVRDAVHRVLGFDVVMNMALGLAAGRPFRNPTSGPLGLEAHWRHATYSAAIVQTLVRKMPAGQRPKPGLAYLAALLHNFGFLFLGHLFRPEFAMLNRLAATKPQVPVVELERQVLAMGEARQVMQLGHAQVGAWLLERWDMPREVVTVVAEHHNGDYAGPHAVYVDLVVVADRLLRRIGLGDGDSDELPEALLQRIGLSEADAEAALSRAIEGQEALDEVARLIAA